MPLPSSRTLRTAVALVCVVPSAWSQGGCLDWRTGFHLPGADQDVRAMTSFTDTVGGTPAFYIGGNFTSVNQTAARRLARWDGTEWSEVGGGIGNTQASTNVSVLQTFDDGTGTKLYVGGVFQTVGPAPGLSSPAIAAWDGSQWHALDSGISTDVFAMTTFDDGSGLKLWVGASSQTVGGVTIGRPSVWDGTTWSCPTTNELQTAVTDFAVHDDGSGPALFACFQSSPIGPAGTRVAKLVGNTWVAVPGSFNNTVNDLESWDDGTGPALYATGIFTTISGANAYRIARWDGVSWSNVGNAFPSGGSIIGQSLRGFDDGTGSQLYLTGRFSQVAGMPAENFARWNGTSWSQVGTGTSYAGAVRLGIFDDGTPNGRKLTLGGAFTRAGGIAVQGLAAWDGSFSTFGTAAGTTGNVSAIAVHDDGTGPALYMGGDFEAAGGAADVRRIGRWTGTNLSSMGAGTDGPIYTLLSHDDGSGSQLYAGGQFTTMDGQLARAVARWNGTHWSPVGVVPFLRATDLFEYDDGAGKQLYAISDEPTVRRWNGVNWSPVSWDPIFVVRATVVFDDGAGAKLYASGTYGIAGGVLERLVMRLDGNSWTRIGAAFDVYPDALTVYDDGAGPRLHAFGAFTENNGVPVLAAAAWDGTTWTQLGGGLGNTTQGGLQVRDTVVWDDHSDARPLLYVVGQFTSAGGTPVSNIAAWDGSAWVDVGTGANARVEAICVFEQPGGPDLYVGGQFTSAGSTVSYRLARFSNSCSQLVGQTRCFGDGSGASCPCANQSPVGERIGCVNSLGIGARLRATGKTSASQDSFALEASGMPNSAILYFQGTAAVNGGDGAPFGDGLRCVGGSIRRLGTKFNSGGGSVYPAPSEASISVRGGIGAFGGVTRYYQGWYRNAASFCGSSTFNLTNALQVFWTP